MTSSITPMVLSRGDGSAWPFASTLQALHTLSYDLTLKGTMRSARSRKVAVSSRPQMWYSCCKVVNSQATQPLLCIFSKYCGGQVKTTWTSALAGRKGERC